MLMTVSLRLNSYLDASPELHRLADKVAQQHILQRYYEQVAPPSLARASHVVYLERNILLLAADNGAVAAKLRQLAPELAQLFRDRGHEVTGIQVRVQVTFPPAKRNTPPTSLSDTGRQNLNDLAEKLPDSPLKNALQRLARNQKKG
ncbi:hypothetical protein RHDC2_00717 [Rhodocyclaceae bacterium]|nr:hypothetical protein RHDC2_00717 [Rhodocyclaceae bacterium]